jgi:hypothetical protein
MLECKYCKNIFSTKSNLKLHQKTAKYCLKMRNEVVKEYKCESCDKSFSVVSSLNRHQQFCKSNSIVNRLSEENLEYEKEINKLRQE